MIFTKKVDQSKDWNIIIKIWPFNVKEEIILKGEIC
jgi:hypothetical protein